MKYYKKKAVLMYLNFLRIVQIENSEISYSMFRKHYPNVLIPGLKYNSLLVKK